MGIGRMMGQLWRLLPDDQKDVSFYILYWQSLIKLKFIGLRKLTIS